MEYCDFQNQYMDKPCNKKMLHDAGDMYCIDHGTRYTPIRAWDLVDDEEEEIESRLWNQEETDKLVELREAGVSVAEIAKILNRTRFSIYSKLWTIYGRN